MLRAVAAGRAQVTCSCEPDLFIDGVSCGDQFTAHMLSHEGFLQAEGSALPGELVPARLTASGAALLQG
jgi:hypothetical protein